MALVAWAWHVSNGLWLSFEGQDKSVATGQQATRFAL